MIDIKRCREWLIELKESVNKQAEGTQIEGVALAVREGHMLRKLKDKRGVLLCAKYPDGKTEGVADSFSTDNDIVLFILEKVPSGQQTDEDELTHYAALQRLMLILRDELMGYLFICADEMEVRNSLTIEWEYDIFGGWNGLSIGLKIEDSD